MNRYIETQYGITEVQQTELTTILLDYYGPGLHEKLTVAEQLNREIEEPVDLTKYQRVDGVVHS